MELVMDIIESASFDTGPETAPCSQCQVASSPIRWLVLVYEGFPVRGPLGHLCETCMEEFLGHFEKSKEIYHALRGAGVSEVSAIDQLYNMYGQDSMD